MSNNDLAGRTLLLTGATGSLGPVVAAKAIERGAAVLLCDISADRLSALVADLGGAPKSAVVSLTDPVAVERLAVEAGNVDAVLHMVGGWKGGQSLPLAPLEDWPWLLERVVTTTMLVARAFAAPLAAAPNGRFVTVSTPQATAPTSKNAAYAAAKAASDAWTLALANEFEGTQATANIVVVPAIVTQQMRAAKPDAAFSTYVSAEAIADVMLDLAAERALGLNGQRIVLQP